MYSDTYKWGCIRLSEKFLSFYKEIIDAQCFLFYISLLNYARTYLIRYNNIKQKLSFIYYHFMKRKKFFGQPNIF